MNELEQKAVEVIGTFIQSDVSQEPALQGLLEHGFDLAAIQKGTRDDSGKDYSGVHLAVKGDKLVINGAHPKEDELRGIPGSRKFVDYLHQQLETKYNFKLSPSYGPNESKFDLDLLDPKLTGKLARLETHVALHQSVSRKVKATQESLDVLFEAKHMNNNREQAKHVLDTLHFFLEQEAKERAIPFSAHEKSERSHWKLKELSPEEANFVNTIERSFRDLFLGKVMHAPEEAAYTIHALQEYLFKKEAEWKVNEKIPKAKIPGTTLQREDLQWIKPNKLLNPGGPVMD